MDGILHILANMDLGIWTYLLLAHGGFWQPNFLEKSQKQPETWPEVCAIIPARNEADALDNTLPTLLVQDYPAFQAILVNDGSEDGTEKIAARIAENHQTSHALTVINGVSRLDWKGKVSAMQSGLDKLSQTGIAPRYILFTDADIAYDKDTLKALVAHAETGEYALTSLMVKLHCESKAERWLIPAFVYFFQMLYPFRWVSNPKRKTAAAAGGCMLVRYDALMKAGGLEPIRAALIDDCALAKIMKKQGRIWLGLTKEIRSVRTYPQVSDIRAMVSRTAYDQLGYSPRNLAFAMAGMALIFIAPVLLAAFCHGDTRFLGIISWIFMSITFFPMVRFYNILPLFCAALPIIADFYMSFTIDSALQYMRGRGGQWKGRMQASKGKNL